MSSYRFCRSDDIPLLARAYNRCYRVHFPGLPELTPDRFKTAIREINLWTSSCMVASQGDDPIAVMLATKRETETLIHSVGVHPEHWRQGHARHLVTSLSAKLAILGPPLLLAEVPDAMPDAQRFIETCGFRQAATYTDYTWSSFGAAPPGSELVIPVSYDELAANEALDRATRRRCWGRSVQTLDNRKDHLQGLAIATDERIEAYLLFEETDTAPERQIAALHAANPERSELWLGLLLRTYAARDSRPIRIPRSSEQEISGEFLLSKGFERGETAGAYEAVPVPG